MNFCQKCAAPMRETVTINHFDAETGRPVYLFKRVCPKRGRFFSGGHSKGSLTAKSRAEAEGRGMWDWCEW